LVYSSWSRQMEISAGPTGMTMSNIFMIIDPFFRSRHAVKRGVTGRQKAR
jgi:hypothetical protein